MKVPNRSSSLDNVSRYRTRGIFITSSSSSSSSNSSKPAGRKRAPLMGHVGARVRVAPLLLVNSSRDRESTHTSDPVARSGYSRANPWKAQTSVIPRYALRAEKPTKSSTLLSFSLRRGSLPNRAEK